MALIANCGGLKISENDFKIVNGIITTTDGEAENYFIASHCGGIKFDSDVFQEYTVDGKKVITLADQISNEYVRANCSILFDKELFEISYRGEVELYNPYYYDLSWNGTPFGENYVNDGILYQKLYDDIIPIELFNGGKMVLKDNGDEETTTTYVHPDPWGYHILSNSGGLDGTGIYYITDYKMFNDYAGENLQSNGIYFATEFDGDEIDIYVSRLYKEK